MGRGWVEWEGGQQGSEREGAGAYQVLRSRLHVWIDSASVGVFGWL